MICVGGTFEYLHSGHRKLLEKAASLEGELHIGLVSDEYASRKGREITPYEERIRKLREYLDSMGISADISPLNDENGECLNPECTDIVV
jgi:pantetheine-phosphate adenylyltransferase